MARLLIIEDNPPNLQLMEYLLKAFGHDADTAGTGEEGLQTAQRIRPSLILCDVQLPTIDGFEVVRRLKSDPALGTVPVLAVTAYAMVGDRDKMLQAGFDGYIPKPIVPETFVGQVEEFLPPEQRSRAAAERGGKTAAEFDVSPRFQHATVLLVNDTPAELHAARQSMEPFGYTVLHVTDNAQALGAARKSRPDLILADVRQPQSAFDLLRNLRTDPQTASIPMLIVCSDGDEGCDRGLADALGRVDFVERPIDPQHLLPRMQAMLHAPPGEEDHA